VDVRARIGQQQRQQAGYRGSRLRVDAPIGTEGRIAFVIVTVTMTTLHRGPTPL